MSGGFTLKDHLDLACCAAMAAKRGATVIISNYYNWYTHQMYSEIFHAQIKKISVNRFISCQGSGRKAVDEMVAIFRP